MTIYHVSGKGYEQTTFCTIAGTVYFSNRELGEGPHPTLTPDTLETFLQGLQKEGFTVKTLKP